jgi:hypothetical protein
VIGRAKLLVMRIHTHRAIGYGRAEQATQIVKPVYEMLGSILVHDGAVNEKTAEG